MDVLGRLLAIIRELRNHPKKLRELYRYALMLHKQP